MMYRLTCSLITALLCAQAHAGPEWVEGTDDAGDAGSISDDAQRPLGTGSLGRVSGQLEGLGGVGLGLHQGVDDDFEDMYLIFIDDPASFRVTTVIQNNGNNSIIQVNTMLSVIVQ